MALSEKHRAVEPNPAPNTLNRGGESVTRRHSPVIDALKKERFMGVPKILAFPLLLLMTTTNAGILIYQEVPPVHRAVDKVLDTSLEVFGLKANQDTPNTGSIDTNKQTK